MNQPSNPLLNQQQQQYGYQQQAPVIGIGEWLVSSTTNPNKANFCKAWLIFVAIAFVLYILLIVFVLSAAGAAGAMQQP